MSGVKYIAAGFVQDADMLLTEFVKEKTLQFSAFSAVWRKHNFSCIFLGRSSAELQQFTHEIFQLSLKFLVSSDLLHQIGGVYLLYGLYRNQPAYPPIRIRILLKQYQHFLELIKLAEKEKCKSLHYVIGYLLQNAFDLVAHPTLVGPRNSKHRMELEKHALQMSCLFKDLKEHSLPLFKNNEFGEIQKLDKAYTELTKSLPFKSNIFQEIAESNVEAPMKNLFSLICDEKYDSEAAIQSEREHDRIGTRRAQIKSDAFASKAYFRQLNPTDEDEEDENLRFTRSRAQRKSLSKQFKFPKEESTENERDEESDEKEFKITRRKRPRIPKEKRRMGRPRKGQDLEQLLIEDDISDSDKLKDIRKRGPVARSSYLEGYIEQPFKEMEADITMLSSSTSEEENIDEPEENIDEFEEYFEEPEEVVTIEDDDYDEVITF